MFLTLNALLADDSHDQKTLQIPFMSLYSRLTIKHQLEVCFLSLRRLLLVTSSSRCNLFQYKLYIFARSHLNIHKKKQSYKNAINSNVLIIDTTKEAREGEVRQREFIQSVIDRCVICQASCLHVNEKKANRLTTLAIILCTLTQRQKQVVCTHSQ